MIKYPRLAILILAPVGLAALSAASYAPPHESLELDEAEVFIEYNSTDGDFGIQFFWDGEPWRRMKVNGPKHRRVLDVRARRNLAQQGLTEGFFESAEPLLSELSMEEFLERFPEGEYTFKGRLLEGGRIVGATEFTHTLPAPPQNLFPAAGATVNAGDQLVVSFDAVTTDSDGNPLEPELYEVIVEHEGEILRVLTMIIDGDVANPSVTVPPEFLTPDTEYKFEVIVQEESGNRTISEIEFSTN